MIFDHDGSLISRDSGVVGEGEGMTSVVAEYAGLIEVLSLLIRANKFSEPLEIRSDNKQLVHQMKGEYKAHEGWYMSRYLEAKRLVSQFNNITFSWIPRDSNLEADGLSREAYSRYISRR